MSVELGCEFLKLNTRLPFFAIHGRDRLDGPNGRWCESKPHDTRSKTLLLLETAPFVFFNNEPFLPRFVGLVRQVRTVRQSRQHFPDGPDRIRLPDCGLFQDEFQVLARIFLLGDPAGKDSKSGLDRFRDFPEESVLIPVVGQQRHSLFKSASVRYHFFRIVRTKVTALFQIAVTMKNIAAAP